jgi:DNA-binding protein H-NS
MSTPRCFGRQNSLPMKYYFRAAKAWNNEPIKAKVNGRRLGVSSMADKKTSFDLDSMTVAELTGLRDAAEAKRQEKLEDAKQAVLERARSELAELGLSLETVISEAARPSAKPGRAARKDAGEPVPVKFRGPNGETWSGRGRLPTWLHTIEAEGKSRNDYAVKAE